MAWFILGATISTVISNYLLVGIDLIQHVYTSAKALTERQVRLRFETRCQFEYKLSLSTMTTS